MYLMTGTSDVMLISFRCFDYLMRSLRIVIGLFLLVVFLRHFAGIKTRKIIAEILHGIFLLLFLLCFSCLVVASTFIFPALEKHGVIITGFFWLVVFLGLIRE